MCLRSPMCSICGSPGKKKGGVRSETNPRVYYARHWVCSNARCPNRDKPQSMHAFEGTVRPFGERH
jgi:hypothetical protein